MISQFRFRRLSALRPDSARVLLAIAAVCAVVTIARAGTSASPPCNADTPQPSYAPVGSAPIIQIWKQQSPTEFPALARCMGWFAPQLRMLVTVAGTFENIGGAPTLLSRFGEVSKLLSVSYWSTTDQKWRPLVMTATALTAKDSGRPREDFTNAELQPGQDQYFSQRDSRGASEVVYRMRVLESDRARLVIATENVTAVRWLAVTLLKTGGLRAMYVLEELSPGIWSYYALTRIEEGSWLVSGHENSYINRVVALYRNIAGIPTDLEPPAAP